MKRFWTLSLRARLMIIGLAGVGIALIMGGLAFFGALTYSVDRTLDNGALASAEEVAAMVNENRLPAPIPMSGAQIVQVVDAQQRVLGGSVTADRLTPLLRPGELATALSGEAVVIDGVRLGVSGPLRVRAIQAGPADARVSVIVALPYGDVLATRTALRNALLITFPLLLGALALIAWRVIGWTLRPVEQLRAGAEQISRTRRISGPTGAERLPVPPAADEIRALALTLNEMLDRLAEARERQRAFVADAAHELRSPLASIQTQLEVAQRLGEGGTLPSELLVDVKRLTGLVEDLLLLAHADADTRPPARPAAIDARDFVAEVPKAYARTGVEVSVVVNEPVMIMVEAEELRRALGNLVDNAVRHARTQVEVAAYLDHGQAVISVCDDGPGIAAEDRERVFERFTRLDHARGRGSGGAGLGLAIVRELIIRAGGTVAFTAAAHPWNTRAELRLPVAPAQQSRTDLVTDS
ncbi:MAG TPA: ATP-binding protein [Propionibacteriaceae bacterium]|nr:ATP-binding protein [Propionibacteriaceae bacterium]